VDEVLQRLAATRHRCNSAPKDLGTQFGVDPTEAPSVAFTWCFNSTTTALEACSYYSERFKAMTTTAAPSVELARQQNGERVVLQTKAHFLFALSSMEYAARLATEKYPHAVPLDKSKKWQYLSNILDKSHALGMIDADTKDLWDGLIYVRNTIVHNNGVASEDRDYVYPIGTSISARAGVMIQGTVGTYAELTEWAVQAYFDWCRAFLQRADL